MCIDYSRPPYIIKHIAKLLKKIIIAQQKQTNHYLNYSLLGQMIMMFKGLLFNLVSKLLKEFYSMITM